uniref:Glutathione S-transferase n=1 Tax=Panagrolaimus sp. PS1159 TaxID=55785 RepID=A0AC35FG07_9BILA
MIFPKKIADENSVIQAIKTGKVPMLEYDGHTIVESYAINRFLAREYGLAGKDKFEQALVDGIADVAKDFFAAVVPWLYTKKEGNAEELKKAHLHEPVEQYLPIFEKFLNESKSGFLAPSGLTWADFVVTEVLISISNQDSKALDKYPAAKDLIKKVKNVSELKDYYASRKE